MRCTWGSVVVVVAVAACAGGQDESPTPAAAANQPTTAARLLDALAGVRAIDNHTHLIRRGEGPPFTDRADSHFPLALRSSNRRVWEAVAARFGIVAGDDRPAAAASAAAKRAARLEELGAAAYWNEHLDAAGVDIALVNQPTRDGLVTERLGWVPVGSALLYPLGADHFSARDPLVVGYVAEQVEARDAALAAAGLDAVPADLAAYEAFARAALAHWKADGAVAIKIAEAYVRPLEFRDVARDRAAALYASGIQTPLSRDDYMALQDYLLRAIARMAGELELVVHFHTGAGRPPFMRLEDADARRLESVLADPTLFDTRFVMLHANAPDPASAAYLAIKPHVFVDTSAIGFLYPEREVTAMLRALLIAAPNKVLFGTDAIANPTIPVGAEIHQIALANILRTALCTALGELVDDGVLTFDQAVAMGTGVLRDNAKSLYGL